MSTGRHARDTAAGDASGMDPTSKRRDEPNHGDPAAPRAGASAERPHRRRMLMGFSWETARILSGVETSEVAPPVHEDE